MTEQQWINRTIPPAQRECPHASRQQSAVYKGWIEGRHTWGFVKLTQGEDGK